MLLLEELSDFEKEELQFKVKRNSEYKDIFRLFIHISFHALWSLSTFHVESYYVNDYETSFINFIQYNT